MLLTGCTYKGIDVAEEDREGSDGTAEQSPSVESAPIAKNITARRTAARKQQEGRPSQTSRRLSTQRSARAFL